MMMNRQIKALVWDFDGTIGDTCEKNLRVTREIVTRVTGKEADEFPALRTVESYGLAQRKTSNWREFYLQNLGFTVAQTNEAGRLWTEYQLKDGSPTPVFTGIDRVVGALQRFPHGIVSQNARSSISRTLDAAGLSSYFQCIIGYEEVELTRQKPEPDGLLLCIEELTKLEPGRVMYIGDHEVDIETADKANRVLERRHVDIRVITVAAMYGGHRDEHTWKFRPDYVVRDPAQILDVMQNFGTKV
jgi:HAD superfamily hydrolase (TIGR01549 family)